MEPRQIEKTVESHDEGQTSPPQPPERKCRFQIVKLEERIAPCNPHFNPQGKFVGGGNCYKGYF
jgi:hypothetical protein